MSMTVEEYNKQNKKLQKQQAKDLKHMKDAVFQISRRSRENHARFWKNVKSGYRSMVNIFR
jgi:hypothetical protein